MEKVLDEIDKMNNSERVDFIKKILDRAEIPDIGIYCCEKCDNVDSRGRFICECCDGEFCSGCIRNTGDYGFCDDCEGKKCNTCGSEFVYYKCRNCDMRFCEKCRFHKETGGIHTCLS